MPDASLKFSAAVFALCFVLFVAPIAAAQAGDSRARRLERAAALVGGDRLAEAERQLAQILQTAPNEAAALNLLGAVRAKQQKLDEAEALFARAVASDVSFAGAHMNLAHLYLLKGAPEKTAARLKEVLRIEPTNSEAGHRLAWLLLSQNRLDECINLAEELQRSQKPSAPLLAVLGDARSRKGDKAAAVAALKSAVELKPDEPSHHFALGVAWLKGRPDLAEAEGCFRRSLELRPGDAPGQLHLGYVLLKQKRHAEAREWLEKSARKTGTPEAFYYLGLIAQGQNEDARAIELFERSIQLAPSFAHAHVALGATYLKLKDYPRAQQSLEIGVKLSPEDPKARYNLAMLYARLKNPERAREEMQAVERLKSEGKTQDDESLAPPSPE